MNKAEVAHSLEQTFEKTLSNPAAKDFLRNSASAFWHNEQKILDNMEDFTAGWFARRHAGSRLALDACECMCNAPSQVDAALEWHTWVTGSVARVADDMFAWQRHLSTCMALLFPASESEARPVSRAEEQAPDRLAKAA